MEFAFTPEQEAFRTRVRSFIKDNWVPLPPSARPGDDESNDADRAYEKRLAKNGWLTMAWPKEYGGRPPATWSSSSSARRAPTPARPAAAARASAWSARP